MPKQEWHEHGVQWSLWSNWDGLPDQIILRVEGAPVAYIQGTKHTETFYADASTVLHTLPAHVHDHLKEMENVRVPEY